MYVEMITYIDERCVRRVPMDVGTLRTSSGSPTPISVTYVANGCWGVTYVEWTVCTRHTATVVV